MPIVKSNNQLVSTPILSKDQFDATGVIRGDEFAICDSVDRLKQIQFNTNAQASNTKVTFASGANSADIVLTLPATSGTLSTGGGGGSSDTLVLGVQTLVPVNEGDTVTASALKSVCVIAPATEIDDVTLALPHAPSNGFVLFVIASTSFINSLTVAGSGGDLVVDTSGALSPGSEVINKSFVYVSSTTTWYVF